MRVVISGSSGLVGGAVQERLRRASYDVIPLVRSASPDNAIHWSPAEGSIEAEKLSGVDAVVHLAGENIADGRWTEQKKRRIRDSRVNGTQLLCTTLAGLENKPRVLVAASAVGFYGDRGAEALDESSPAGNGFLAETCQAWEAATEPAEAAGIRVVRLRMGMILSRDGGALKKMLLPFQMGVGGRVGDGSQYMSWISLNDVSLAIQAAIENQELSGAVNLVSPNPLTNSEFTRALGKVLRRPTIFPMPAFAAKIAFGEMAEAVLLSSSRVYPKKLQQAGFAFEHPDLESALQFHLRN